MCMKGEEKTQLVLVDWLMYWEGREALWILVRFDSISKQVKSKEIQ